MQHEKTKNTKPDLPDLFYNWSFSSSLTTSVCSTDTTLQPRLPSQKKQGQKQHAFLFGGIFFSSHGLKASLTEPRGPLIFKTYIRLEFYNKSSHHASFLLTGQSGVRWSLLSLNILWLHDIVKILSKDKPENPTKTCCWLESRCGWVVTKLLQ